MAQAKTKHSATLPDGTVATRVSVSRRYSHCIAVRSTYEAALASAMNSAHKPADRREFAYWAEKAAQQPGVSRTIHVTGSARAWSYERAETAEEIEQAKARIEGCANAEDYAAKCRAERIAKVEADKAAGGFDRWSAGSWASRLDLAHKATGQFPGCETRVIAALIA